MKRKEDRICPPFLRSYKIEARIHPPIKKPIIGKEYKGQNIKRNTMTKVLHFNYFSAK